MRESSSLPATCSSTFARYSRFSSRRSSPAKTRPGGDREAVEPGQSGRGVLGVTEVVRHQQDESRHARTRLGEPVLEQVAGGRGHLRVRLPHRVRLGELAARAATVVPIGRVCGTGIGIACTQVTVETSKRRRELAARRR